MAHNTETEDITLIDIESVMAHTSLSKASIYRLMKSNRFPKAVALLPDRRRVAWKENEVLQWADSPLDWPGDINF